MGLVNRMTLPREPFANPKLRRLTGDITSEFTLSSSDSWRGDTDMQETAFLAGCGRRFIEYVLKTCVAPGNAMRAALFLASTVSRCGASDTATFCKCAAKGLESSFLSSLS